MNAFQKLRLWLGWCPNAAFVNKKEEIYMVSYEGKYIDKIRGMELKYIPFLVIGILSFYISGFLLGILSETYGIGIHGPEAVSFMLFTYVILLAASLIVSKERSFGFILKAFALSFAAMFLISVAFFAWGAYEEVNDKWINAHRLQAAPDKFVIITDEELNQYPALKEAIKSQSDVKVKPDEWKRTDDYLDQKGSRVIKVNEVYYEIGFVTS
ncbi:MAG: hypothetical protein WA102_11480 [Candidatus Methanoperedens sp.]